MNDLLHQNEKEYVFVCGYGWSGSSALVDLLKEIEGFDGLDKEFRLIKERGGLIDLEDQIVKQYDPLETDLSIKQFLRLARSYDRIPQKFTRYGMAYKEYFGNEFIEETYRFVDQLTAFKYHNYWFYFSFEWNAIKRLIKRIIAKINPYSIYEDCYFPTVINEEEYNCLVKKYLNNIFTKQNDSKFLIMDQSVPANRIEYAYKYFDNVKVIIVDRDPRDIYAEMVRQKQLIGYDLSTEDSAEKYIKWHKLVRLTNTKNIYSDKTLTIRFEDLVFNYEQTVAKILQYLDIKQEKHVDRKRFFDPGISQKNIGIWKYYPNQDVMNEIKESLGDYCYEQERKY